MVDLIFLKTIIKKPRKKSIGIYSARNKFVTLNLSITSHVTSTITIILLITPALDDKNRQIKIQKKIIAFVS